MSAKTIAFINLKGGVAKTTTAVGTALILAGTLNRRVLMIDLDPQTNCTTMLIGEEKWQDLNSQGKTLCTMFKDAIDDTNNFDINSVIQKNVSGIRDVYKIDLLPSSLDMIDLQDRIAFTPQGKFYSNNPTEILKRAVRDIKNNYDYILIDCPPNMGLITLNGLRISDGYIIPAIPDVLSTYGIPQIVTRIDQFFRSIGENIKCLGVVATKVRAKSTLHANILKALEKEKDAPMFRTRFREDSRISEAAEFRETGTIRQRLGYGAPYNTFEEFAQEIEAKI